MSRETSQPVEHNSPLGVADPVRENLTVAVVVLTTGQREGELRALADSLDEQPLNERLLIVNGGSEVGIKGWAETALATNIGVPAGRSLGASMCTSDVIVYLDDDCAVVSSDLIARTAVRFRDRSDLGALGFRVQATGGGEPMRRWTPASSSPDPDGLRMSTTFPGGGHAVRRSAFHQVGGYCDALFFKHEETDLSWRLLDRGWEVAYDEQCIVEHPPTPEGRHLNAFRVGARNKVWIARMGLPMLLLPASMVITIVRYLGRCRRLHDVVQVGTGIRQGLGTLPSPRGPMSWRTVWKLTKRGRPPIL